MRVLIANAVFFQVDQTQSILRHTIPLMDKYQKGSQEVVEVRFFVTKNLCENTSVIDITYTQRYPCYVESENH